MIKKDYHKGTIYVALEEDFNRNGNWDIDKKEYKYPDVVESGKIELLGRHPDYRFGRAESITYSKQ